MVLMGESAGAEAQGDIEAAVRLLAGAAEVADGQGSVVVAARARSAGEALRSWRI